jgi:hypothetical protein
MITWMGDRFLVVSLVVLVDLFGPVEKCTVQGAAARNASETCERVRRTRLLYGG